ncbi:hypothetical protein RE428_47520 [Marinobacter nanhaiticus D15-8W]|uniref:Uncharacterized protein n=1 Tax=Marinobacter nanhaiticus D15-8W TaxID=626887 RepID=N6WWI2_9GAMM|nr:hypothetical protein [Marinobacter nanhaiticus]ENO15417.1 hypothetical protein J057_08701 [Marinobacter nanhaiticus D15-8W]BES73734.1 hypothetical protein RE428_47520 [Marinobacter nanhaiticus D15-8W]
MRIIEPSQQDTQENSRLDRLYRLKQQQLQRASDKRKDSLLCRVLAAEADAISSAIHQAMPEKRR